MAEYIEREALLNSKDWQALQNYDRARAKAIVLGQPAVDVVPVRYGKWIKEVDEYEICATEFVCSCCKESFVSSELTDDQFTKMLKFCPGCGADMGGVNDG